MQKRIKPESLGVGISKLILAVSFIVSFGAILGAAGYLAKNPKIESIIYQPLPIAEVTPSVKDKTTDWNDYRFELEDITKAEDFNTRIWKIDIKTNDKEVFVESTKENAGIALDNFGFPGIIYPSKEILKIDEKLFFRPYNPGMAPGPSAIWQLDLNTKIFKKLSISKILGSFASEIWSVDGKKIIVIPSSDIGDAKNMYLVDLLKDEYRLSVKLKDNETFSPNKDDIGIGKKAPDIKWLDNIKIKYAVYDQSKKSFEGYDRYKEEVAEKILIDLSIPDKTEPIFS